MIKLHKSEDNQYYFTICGKKGQVVSTSEMYTRKSSRNRQVLKVNSEYKVPKKIVDCDWMV